MGDAANNLLRQLPGINELLERADVLQLLETTPRLLVTEAARAVLGELRRQVRAGEVDAEGLKRAVQALGQAIAAQLKTASRPRLRRVINATGVILQTNLGRAPLSAAALERIAEVARGYCNLEFELEAGERSRRDVHVEELILEVLGQSGVTAPGTGPKRETMAAAVVNNCAAATFLALNTLAEGGEVIVSRGELVEIGGGFRIPEILAKSGAVLREVGTTNKTRIGDYAAAIGPATKLLLRVHRSNFKIEGFTEQPSLPELVALGQKASVPVFEDQGTGSVTDLDAVGLHGESSWVRSVASGAALVAASGDKLLGGPQCGLLAGEREVVERVRANPLYRVLRVDKLTYAALEATLWAYASGASDNLPILQMMRTSADAIRQRCEKVASRLRSAHISAEIVPTRSVVGGGTTPGATLPGFAVALNDRRRGEDALAAWLRGLDPAVVSRVSEGRVLLDLRSVAAWEDEDLVATLDTALREDPTEGL